MPASVLESGTDSVLQVYILAKADLHILDSARLFQSLYFGRIGQQVVSDQTDETAVGHTYTRQVCQVAALFVDGRFIQHIPLVAGKTYELKFNAGLEKAIKPENYKQL